MDASRHDLGAATKLRPRSATVFDLDVPDGWQQGRGAFGGWSLAVLVRAVEHYAAERGEGEPRPLRSLTAALPSAALVGPAEISVEPVRVGKGLSTVTAKLVQGGEVRAHATVILARNRAPGASAFCELSPPSLRPFDATPSIPMGEFGPVFSRHFDYRTDGPYPFTAGKEARATGWVRAKHVGDLSKAALVVALADAYWPATFARATAPFPIGTVAFTLQTTSNLDAWAHEEPLAYRAHTWVQAEGFFVEQRELWTKDGVLVALNQQTFAVIA